MTGEDVKTLATDLRKVVARIPDLSTVLSPAQSRKLLAELQEVAAEFRKRLGALDPVSMPDSFFNPADPRLFAMFAAIALIGQDRIPLDRLESMRFYGSGLYAIYYDGDFDLYRPLRGSEHPIYVGKADPKNAHAQTPQAQGATLCARLREHRKNISKAKESVRIEDFTCRFLVVASGWQEASESALIGLFTPLWNKETNVIQGFGKHGDSRAMRGHPRSPWDTLHAGRGGADEGAREDAMSREEIAAETAAHFGRHPVIRDAQTVLHQLLTSIRVS